MALSPRPQRVISRGENYSTVIPLAALLLALALIVAVRADDIIDILVATLLTVGGIGLIVAGYRGDFNDVFW